MTWLQWAGVAGVLLINVVALVLLVAARRILNRGRDLYREAVAHHEDTGELLQLCKKTLAAARELQAKQKAGGENSNGE